MARHNTQNGQKCCDKHSLFKSAVHKWNNVSCSMGIIHIARCRRRRISVPTVLTLTLLFEAQSREEVKGGVYEAPLRLAPRVPRFCRRQDDDVPPVQSIVDFFRQLRRYVCLSPYSESL